MARISGVNLPTNKCVKVALTYIYGIGPTIAKEICKVAGISDDKRVNKLTDDEVLKIREYIESKFKVEGDLRSEVSLNIRPFFFCYNFFVSFFNSFTQNIHLANWRWIYYITNLYVQFFGVST